MELIAANIVGICAFIVFVLTMGLTNGYEAALPSEKGRWALYAGFAWLCFVVVAINAVIWTGRAILAGGG